MRCMSQYVANKNVFSERLKLSLPTAGSLTTTTTTTYATRNMHMWQINLPRQRNSIPREQLL